MTREIIEGGGHEVIVGKSFSPESSGLTSPYPRDELMSLIREADLAIGGRRAKFERAVLQGAPRLQGVVTTAIGYESIDVDAATELGIVVSNSPQEVNYNGVVQHTTALILTLVRKLDNLREFARTGQRGTKLFESPEMLPVYLNPELTLGVVGFGRIGFRVARIFREIFRTRVIAYDPYVQGDRAELIGVEMVERLEDLLRQSDIITIHTWLSGETRRMIGAEELSMMKRTALIVNTARGGIIDETALIEALRAGRVAGAALDVMEVEPARPDNPLLSMKNVIITPHMAGHSEANMVSATQFAARNALRILSGKLPNSLVNLAAVPKWNERFGGKRSRDEN